MQHTLTDDLISAGSNLEADLARAASGAHHAAAQVTSRVDGETEQALGDMHQGHRNPLTDHGGPRGAIDLPGQAGTRFQDVVLQPADQRAPLSRIRAGLRISGDGLYTLLGWVIAVALVAVLLVSGIGVAITIALLIADVSDPQPRTHRRC